MNKLILNEDNTFEGILAKVPNSDGQFQASKVIQISVAKVTCRKPGICMVSQVAGNGLEGKTSSQVQYIFFVVMYLRR